MKKFTLIALCVASGMAATAQVGLRAGAHFGFNDVFIQNQNSYGFSEMDYVNKFGIYPGVDIAYNFDGMNGVQVEINFATMGQDYYDRNRDFSFGADEDTRPKVDTYRNIDLRYLHIPVMYRFQTEKKKKTKAVFHAMAGPTFGFLMSADMTYEADVQNNGQIEEVSLAIIEGAIPDFAATDAVEEPVEYFRSMDLGLQFAVGADVYASKVIYFTPQMRAYYGFSDINSLPTRDLYTDFGPSKNVFVGICVGVHYLVQN